MKNFTSPASRREFLRRAGAFSVAVPAAPFALNLAAIGSASAQSAGGYKALVCLYFSGGNDGYNTVLATDTNSWASYLTVRTQAPDPIALRAPGTAVVTGAAAGSPDRLGGVLAITPLRSQGRSFAVHPVMTGVRDLFSAKRLAIVSNVGTLLRPTSKAQYKDSTFPKPKKLFSHNDQTSEWMTFASEGARIGWGGRMGDLLLRSNTNAVFTSISTAGNAVWLSGQNVVQYQVTTSGAIRIGGTGTTLYGSATALTKARRIMRTTRSSNLLEQAQSGVVGRSIDAEGALSAALPAANTAPYGTPGLAAGVVDPLLQYDNPLTGGKSTNPLAQQLQIVARTIAGRSALGVQRQVFFVNVGGFDNHDFQNRTQANNLALVSHALKYFDTTLTAMGVGNDVTTFTASDFGRTFTSNGDGTDHGWGSHHFVLGGAVHGGDLYGNFPAYGVSDTKGDFGSPNQIGNGAMLPEISVDQYAATLARWFGVSDSQALDIFPNLTNFDVSLRNLGFMA